MLRVVLDTNIFVRGLVNIRSYSGRILTACEDRRIIPLLRKSVLTEYRTILSHTEIVSRYPELEPKKVRVAIERLCYVGDVFPIVTARFKFPRDPRDEKIIESAIAAEATHIISTDRDLLHLPHGRDDASKRFRQRMPKLEVLQPEEFLRAI